MLIITTKIGDPITVTCGDHHLTIMVTKRQGHYVKFGFSGPRDIFTITRDGVEPSPQPASVIDG